MLPILLILTAAFAVLTWSDLHKGLFVLVAVLPSYLLRTEIFGIPTTLLELLVVTFLIVWMVRRSPVPPIPKEWVAATIVFVFLVATISVFVAPDMTAALGVWKAYFLEPILLFFVVRYELKHAPTPPNPLFDRELRVERPSGRGGTLAEQLFVALGVSALILSLVAILQWLTGMGLPIPWDIERRVTSVFDYPNALGLFLGPIVIIGITTLLSHFSGVTDGAEAPEKHLFSLLSRFSGVSDWAKAPLNFFWIAVAGLSSISIILAQSEAAIVSIIATLLVASLVHRRTRSISLILLVLLTLLTLLTPPLLSKLTLQDYSGEVRLSQWSETVDLLRDHWFLGAGLSGYPIVMEPYHKATHFEIFQYPHNIILNIWVELGLLGVIAFVLLALIIVRRVAPKLPPSLKLRGAGKPGATFSSTIAFLALLQMTIHGLVDVPYFKNDLAILTWILLAIIFAYARPASTSKTSRS
ncbi:O-antigen ligase domain-containing protein [Patescibacteria group bacterium]|nr:MAG: O-antigen ligase domain-containing protein [Patescibacteria group bacterium]